MRWSNVLLTKLFSGNVWDVVFVSTRSTLEHDLVLTAYGDGHIKVRLPQGQSAARLAAQTIGSSCCPMCVCVRLDF